MAPPKLTGRTEPAVVPGQRPPMRPSKLPSYLRVPILIVLNLGIHAALLSSTDNFLKPELGAISKKATGNTADELFFSLHSPLASIVFKLLTIHIAWRLEYDFLDVAALAVIAHAPYIYLVTTYYEISTLTASTHLAIEVISFVIPTYLLRPRSTIHNPNVPLRNRFLLNSTQVQISALLLACGVYVTVIYSAVKTGVLNILLVTHFDIPTLEIAHAEHPVSVILKTFTAGIAAKTFLLDPSIAAQPSTGNVTPSHDFDPATATLPETVQHNVWFFSRRTRALIRQTLVLNAFLFTHTVQKCLTIQGSDIQGAAGYAGFWVLANVICSGWWAWVGDTDA